MTVFQPTSHLHNTGPVGIGFHHRHGLGRGTELGAEFLQVASHRPKVHLRPGRVRLFPERSSKTLHTEAALPFDKHGSIRQIQG